LAVKLRLRRMGKKKQPIYKVVAADSRSPRDGKFIEAIGLYNPLTDPHTVDIKEDRALYWLSAGAQPTDTVKSLLRQKGITLKRELIRKKLPDDKIQEEMENWAKQKEAKQAKTSKKPKAVSEDKPKEEPKVEPKEEPKVEPKEEISNEGTAEAKGAASDQNS
jgi:small subunit ribosomal protein S16